MMYYNCLGSRMIFGQKFGKCFGKFWHMFLYTDMYNVYNMVDDSYSDTMMAACCLLCV